MAPVKHKSERCRRRSATGFTLTELLVVFSVIALLISILLPSLRKARDQTMAQVCRSNLRQVGLGMFYFTHDNRGYYPDSMKWFGNYAFNWNWPGMSPSKFTSPAANPSVGLQEGWVFRYVGRNRKTFLCPSDDGRRALPHFAMPPGHTNFAMQDHLQSVSIDANRKVVVDGKEVYFREDILLQSPARVMLMMEESELAPCNDGKVIFTGWDVGYWNAQLDAITARHSGRGHMFMFDGHTQSTVADRFNLPGRDSSRYAGMLYDAVYTDRGRYWCREKPYKNPGPGYGKDRPW